MRKILGVVGWVVGGFVVLVVLAAAIVFWRSGAVLKKNYTVAVRAVAVPADAAAIERGRHLARSRGCIDCHGADFGGAKVVENGAMGLLFGPNLTKGRGSRTGEFQDEDWVRAIRHGVGPDGYGLFLMPSEEYANMGDSDLGPLIAFLKSVPPVDRDRVPIQLGPISRMLVATGKMKPAAEIIDHPNVRPPSLTPAVTPDYGRYIAVGCTGCHGPNFSGGRIEIGPPDWPPAANLTPHPDSRLSKWTEAEFINSIRTAKRPDGSEVSPVMPRAFANLDDVELKALWLYLKSLPSAATGVR